MEYMTAAEAAKYARRHPETIREALRGRELRGMQRGKGGSWTIRRDWVDAWIMGEEAAA